jgi:hypothetical protein
MVAAGDFNHDGKMDLAVVNYGANGLNVLLGNGNGTFQNPVGYFTGSAPTALAVADLDGDSKLDIAVSNSQDSNVAVLKGNGDGTFQQAVKYNVGNGPLGVAVRTVAGQPSIVVAENSSSFVGELLSPHFLLSGPATPVTAGKLFGVTVTAVDPGNNLVPGYTGTIHFNSTDPLAQLPPSFVFTAGNHGQHGFAVTLKKVGSRTIIATDTADLFTAGRVTETVTPAQATHFALVPSTRSPTAGTAFSLTIFALDPYGNIATGYTGTAKFTSTDPNATLPTPFPFQVSDAGRHTFTNGVTLKSTGSRTITATDTTNQKIAGSTTVTVGSVSALNFTGIGLNGLSPDAIDTFLAADGLPSRKRR